MSYQIRHLSVGGVLDQAFSIIKDHFGLLLSICAILFVPISLVIGLASVAVLPEPPPPGATPEQQMEYFVEVSESGGGILGIANIALALIVLPVTNAAIIDAVARFYLGQQTTAGESIKYAFSRLLPLIGTSILVGIVVFLGFLACIIPGILFLLWYSLVTHVIVIEGISGTDAMSRSKDLVRGNIGTLIILGLLLGVINIGIMLGAGLISEPYVSAVLTTLAQALTTIVGSAAMVVFYFSCRCDHEDFDLEHLANSIEGAPPRDSGAPTWD